MFNTGVILTERPSARFWSSSSLDVVARSRDWTSPPSNSPSRSAARQQQPAFAFPSAPSLRAWPHHQPLLPRTLAAWVTIARAPPPRRSLSLRMAASPATAVVFYPLLILFVSMEQHLVRAVGRVDGRQAWRRRTAMGAAAALSRRERDERAERNETHRLTHRTHRSALGYMVEPRSVWTKIRPETNL